MAAKRILLMYITEVSGHHSATLAIEKAVRALSPEAKILNINAFNYTNPISEKIVNRLYMGVIKRTPKLWDYLYDNPHVIKRIEKVKDFVHKVNSPKLLNLFNRFHPDVICCTQAFPCGMVADFKRTYKSAIPLVAVLTDYVPHSYWLYDTVDYYIAPSEEVAVRLNKKGVPQQKIKPFGIPFDPHFNAHVEKDKVFQKMKLDRHLPTILIMGGGQGLGPIKKIVASLEKVDRDIQEIVVCGTNTRLYRSLRRKIKKCRKKILNLGYVDNMHELMSIADIIITKPGGITAAEALAKSLPMIIVKPLPGQEASNTQYLAAKQAAIEVDDPSEIYQVIEELLHNSQKLKQLGAYARLTSKPNASLDIARLILSL